jgi:hypothetical protein
VSTPVTIALYPSLIHFDGMTPPADGNWSPMLDRLLSIMIKQGLRARLAQKLPLIGDTVVSLEIQQNAKPADLVAGGQYKEIPAEAAGGIDALMAKAGNLPLDQIGDNIRKITEQINGIVSSPEIKSSIDHLNDTLADLDKTVRHVGPQIAPWFRACGAPPTTCNPPPTLPTGCLAARQARPEI